MPTLDIDRTYNDGDVLFESDLDAICDDIETLLNTTKLNDDNIQDAGITGSTKLINASVTQGKLATDSVSTAKIVDLAVTTAKINDLGVTAAKLAADAVTTAKILDSNVTTAKIADSNVTTAKIADSNVTTAKIADSNVTTAKIADSNVTTAKLADGAATRAKMTANITVTSSSGNYTDSTSTTKTVTNLSAAITTNAKPVSVYLVSDGGGQISYLQGTGTSPNCHVYFMRDASEIAHFEIGGQKYPPGAFRAVDIPAAGSYTYTCKINADGITVAYCKLVAEEV